MHHSLCQRGRRFYFVCRIPRDLKRHFPREIFWKSLHSSDKKTASALSLSYFYEAQKLFMQLRSGMLTPDLEKRLADSFLLHGVARIESQALGQEYSPPVSSISPVDQFFSEQAKFEDLWHKIESYHLKDVLKDEVTVGQLALTHKENQYSPISARSIAEKIKDELGISLTEAELKSLCLRFVDARIQLAEAESAALGGRWEHFRAIKRDCESTLKSPYVPIAHVISKYKEHFRISKPNIKIGTINDMEVECRVLAEIVGNISIAAFNTMDTVIQVKAVLRRYPLNRQQRFGDTPLYKVLRTASAKEVICPKTANEYLKRARALVKFAAKHKMVQDHNVWEHELFQIETAAEEERDAYERADIERLIEAICTQPLYRYAPPKPERFWLILIALFHGLRLGNIVALTKDDVRQTDKGIWVFKIRQGKTKSTIRDVAIQECLLLLGFLEWADGLKRHRLFQDSSASFSKWFNRNEVRPDKQIIQGFEAKFVTTDPKKCLHSLRHAFAVNVFAVSEDFKITRDLMGHSTSNKITSRYMKNIRTEKLKKFSDQMALEGIDLNKLEQRAIELFFNNPV